MKCCKSHPDSKQVWKTLKLYWKDRDMLIFEIKSKVKLPSRRINQGPLHFRGNDAAKYNGTLITYFQTKPGKKEKKILKIPSFLVYLLKNKNKQKNPHQNHTKTSNKNTQTNKSNKKQPTNQTSNDPSHHKCWKDISAPPDWRVWALNQCSVKKSKHIYSLWTTLYPGTCWGSLASITHT